MVETITDFETDRVAQLGQLVYLVSVHVHTYMQKGHLYWERYINDCIRGTEMSCFLFSALFLQFSQFQCYLCLLFLPACAAMAHANPRTLPIR